MVENVFLVVKKARTPKNKKIFQKQQRKEEVSGLPKEDTVIQASKVDTKPKVEYKFDRVTMDTPPRIQL